MTTVALWHLGMSGVLAGALSSVILVQSLVDGLRRRRHRPHRAVPSPVQSRPVVEPRPVTEPRTVRLPARAVSEAPAMASAAAR